MKYIRTKDGIYENNTRFSDKTLNEVSSGLIEIIKQADTIEELCDTFIAVGDKGVICAFSTFEELKKFDYTLYGGYQELIEKYGAIYIKDKGLIYIAKMNEKGELEFL